MKKLILSFGILSLLIGLTANSFAQETTFVPGPQLSVDKEVHDYGKIEKNADGSCYFSIVNTGTEPLVISNAKGSCGCTVPDWPREAIAPGDTAQMKVTYATNRVGLINKTVTITSNSTDGASKTVRIKGEVLKPDAQNGAPVLKQKSPVIKP